MKFAKSAIALLYLASHANAWTTARALPRSRLMAAAQLHSLATDVVGEQATESFRLAFKEGDKPISPWHDIDLKNEDGTYNMVCKILLLCGLVAPQSPGVVVK